MKRGKNGEDDNAGDEEQGFSTAITHDDVTEEGANNNTAENEDTIAAASADDQSGPIIGTKKAGPEGPADKKRGLEDQPPAAADPPTTSRISWVIAA